MKKPVMTREEIDERILNRIPHSGCHHYDGIFFLAGLFADGRRKKREILEKLKLSREQEQAGVKMESPKEVQKLESIDV